jgi:hypothetical protein
MLNNVDASKVIGPWHLSTKVKKSFQGPHHALNNAVFELTKGNEIQVNARDDGKWKTSYI